MANVKISQLTAKASNLASTDLIPIAESDGVGGYVTKHITGAEVVGGAGSTTLYNSDGLISSNRTINANNNTVIMSNIKNLAFLVTPPSVAPFISGAILFGVDTSNITRAFEVYSTDQSQRLLMVSNNGYLEINESYTLPNADGVQGQVLRTDGSGSLSFSNLSIGLFSQTADGTPVTNTTTPTNIIGTGVGTLSVPANAFQVGDSFHCNIKGDISSLNNETLLIELKSGAVILASSGTLTLPVMTNQPFEIETDFTIRAIGAATTASIFTCSEFNYIQNSGTSFQGKMFQTLNNTTFDTTVSNTLEVHVTWGSASTSNSITSHLTNLRRTY